MAKKTFTTGIDTLISSTTKKDNGSPAQIQQEELTSVMFRIPVSLKIKMEHYCTDNRIKQQELIINAIKKHIE
jgi:hypothetical protein